MLVIRIYCGADAFMEAVRMSLLCKRRLLFLEAVRMGKSASCVLYRKIRMRVTQMTMRATCHCKMRATCLEGRGPYNAPLFNLPILPEQKWAGYKIIGFLKSNRPFVWLGHVASGGAEAKKGIYDEPSTLGIPRQHVVSMMALFGRLAFRGLVSL